METLGSFTLHAHQIAAVKWMMERELDDKTRGGFLCDQMGLGKTLSMIGLLCHDPKPVTLVLCPLPVIHQWAETILESDGPCVYLFEKSRWSWQGGDSKKGRVYICNYEKLPKVVLDRFDRIVCDEAHFIRNHKSKKYLNLKKLECGFYWFLSGTPIVNRLTDFTTLLHLANRSFLPNKNISANKLEEVVGSYVLCRTIEHLEGQDNHIRMPPKPEIIEHRLPFLTETEGRFYRAIQGRLGRQFQELMEQEHAFTTEMLTLLLRLRQISVHPQVYIESKRRSDSGYSRPDWVGPTTKTEKIIEILNKDKGSHGYVIFCNFKDELNLLEEQLSKEACVATLSVYHGSMNAQERIHVVKDTRGSMETLATSGVDDLLSKYASHLPQLPLEVCGIIQNYIGPRHVVLLAQIHCAGTGLNLQHMDRVIFTSPWWTAALMDQAAGRVLRIGQTKNVKIHHVYLQEEMETSLNIDDYINERVSTKRGLCKRLLELAKY